MVVMVSHVVHDVPNYAMNGSVMHRQRDNDGRGHHYGRLDGRGGMLGRVHDDDYRRREFPSENNAASVAVEQDQRQEQRRQQGQGDAEDVQPAGANPVAVYAEPLGPADDLAVFDLDDLFDLNLVVVGHGHLPVHVRERVHRSTIGVTHTE